MMRTPKLNGRPLFLGLLLALLTPIALWPQDDELNKFDLETRLREREPSFMLSLLKEGLREKAEDGWYEMVEEDADLAEARNQRSLYPNPSLQVYVNQLGKELVPQDVRAATFISFKIVEDPMPYADALATGTVFVSSGMLSMLDNEAQLAFVLMQEAGHIILSHQLYQVIDEEKSEKRQRRGKAAINTVAGLATLGMVGGGITTQMIGNVSLFGGAGKFGAGIYGRFRSRRFDKTLQREADDFAVETILANGYDIREVPVFLTKMKLIIDSSSHAVEIAFGNADDLPARSSRIVKRINNIYLPEIDATLNGDGFKMASPRFNQLLSELRRDNGLLALKTDLFSIAKRNLEDAAAIRTDDPMTMHGLGVLYRSVARTPEERSKAAQYFKAAIDFDRNRHSFPAAYLDYGVELLSLEDPAYYPEIQQALKSYVTFYQRNEGGKLPPEMSFIYDYLELTGDNKWIAYNVSNVSTEVPHQIQGGASQVSSLKRD